MFNLVTFSFSSFYVQIEFSIMLIYTKMAKNMCAICGAHSWVGTKNKGWVDCRRGSLSVLSYFYQYCKISPNSLTFQGEKSLPNKILKPHIFWRFFGTLDTICVYVPQYCLELRIWNQMSRHHESFMLCLRRIEIDPLFLLTFHRCTQPKIG